MGKHEKLRQKILLGESDANISFDGLCGLLKRMGFECRVKGSHHVFSRDGVEEILNLQPRGKAAKAYHVEQVRKVILKYSLDERTDD